jgi:L-histidine N-alpha-methyltransferase
MQVSQHYAGDVGYPGCIVVPPTREVPELAEDVLRGILTPPRSLPPKYFYDGYGSLLFERICGTSEYYLTRTEEELLVRFAEPIVSMIKGDEILELGSGNCRKIRHLFDACEKQQHICSYAPFDVCEEVLLQAADALRSEYSWLEVTPLTYLELSGHGSSHSWEVQSATSREMLQFNSLRKFASACAPTTGCCSVLIE